MKTLWDKRHNVSTLIILTKNDCLVSEMAKL